MHDLSLPGARPEPLINYLKALGVLRTIVEQKVDPDARAYWRDDVFHIVCAVSSQELSDFFLYRYAPSPIVAPWLASFRRAVNDKTPPRFSSALRRIERAIFDYCRYGGAAFFQAILVALGRAEAELATGESFRTSLQTRQTIVRPLSGLSPRWIEAARDNSSEFGLALSLAANYDAFRIIGPLRANLEPVDWKGQYRGWASKDRTVVWNSTDLSSNLAAVLERRLVDGARAGCERSL